MKLGNSIENSGSSVITRSRHRIHLDQANKSLSTFIGIHFFLFLIILLFKKKPRIPYLLLKLHTNVK